MKKIRIMSLFCGCGGTDLGALGGFSYLGKRYAKLPVEIIHASDINEKAVNTYNMNFRHKAEVFDIRKPSFSLGYADIVMGCFPCQAFSTVNPTKEPHKKANYLFYDMARILEEIKPKIFISENVKGFYRLGGGVYFSLAKKAFEKAGYKVYDTLLNSSDYGVPQVRERVVMVGVHKSIKKGFLFPSPTHGSQTNGFRPKTCLRDVIENLIPPHEKYYFSRRAVEGVKRAKPNMKRALAQNLDGQCLTITSHLAKASLNSRDPVLLVSPEQELYRRFTPREAARIQSFPDSFMFAGTEQDAYRQIGNAVPPVMMYHVMKAVLVQFFDAENCRRQEASFSIYSVRPLV